MLPFYFHRISTISLLSLWKQGKKLKTYEMLHLWHKQVSSPPKWEIVLLIILMTLKYKHESQTSDATYYLLIVWDNIIDWPHQSRHRTAISRPNGWTNCQTWPPQQAGSRTHVIECLSVCQSIRLCSTQTHLTCLLNKSKVNQSTNLKITITLNLNAIKNIKTGNYESRLI